MVAFRSMPIDPMAWAGYAPGSTAQGPGWVRAIEVPAGSIVIESGSRLRVERNGPTDQWMVTGRGGGDGVALVALDGSYNTFRTVDIATLLVLNPRLLHGFDTATATAAWTADMAEGLIRLTTHDDAEHDTPVAEFVDAHIEELRSRLVLLVDVG